MSDETLKPCPFCGSKDVTVERLGTRAVSTIVTCDECGTSRESGREGAESGLRTWNERADETRIRAEAAAERTREITEWLERDAEEWADHGDEFPVGSPDRKACRAREAYARMRVTALRDKYPAAFPQLRSGDGR